MKTLSEVQSRITAGLEAIHGFRNVKRRKGEIGWIVTHTGSPALRWVFVSEVSGLPSEFIRLRNDIVPLLPKSFWRGDRPHAPKFELTVLGSEITDEFIEQLSRFVSANATGQGKTFRWPLFETVSFHSFYYAWSIPAEPRRREYCAERAR